MRSVQMHQQRDQGPDSHGQRQVYFLEGPLRPGLLKSEARNSLFTLIKNRRRVHHLEPSAASVPS